VLHDVRVPDGYSSNVSRCVKLKECTVGGLKSHDNHIIMQQLMPIALQGTLSDDVVRPLIKLCGFFRDICSKTLRVEDLDRLENQICKLEQIFSPGFFTSMVHVIIHLVRECKLGEPVHYRWMYPVER
jgi:hypothetical protein